jgi:hypothetical protein
MLRAKSRLERPGPTGTVAERHYGLRTVRTVSSGAAVAVAAVFALLILVLPGPGIGLHEIAGALLLGLIATALLAAVPMRSTEPAPYRRILGALIALIATGAAGLALATGAVPRSLSAIPLVGILALGTLLADSIRVAVRA